MSQLLLASICMILRQYHSILQE